MADAAGSGTPGKGGGRKGKRGGKKKGGQGQGQGQGQQQGQQQQQGTPGGRRKGGGRKGKGGGAQQPQQQQQRTRVPVEQLRQHSSQANLSTLQRLDPAVTAVLHTAAHVVMYRLGAGGAWDQMSCEGPAFLAERAVAPRFKMLVLNRSNPRDFELTLDVVEELETDEHKLYVQATGGVVYCAWFHESAGANRFHDITAELAQRCDRPAQQPQQPPQQQPPQQQPPPQMQQPYPPQQQMQMHHMPHMGGPPPHHAPPPPHLVHHHGGPHSPPAGPAVPGQLPPSLLSPAALRSAGGGPPPLSRHDFRTRLEAELSTEEGVARLYALYCQGALRLP